MNPNDPRSPVTCYPALPWSVRAVERLWEQALREARGDRAAALARFDAAERAPLVRDAVRVWGPQYPAHEIRLGWNRPLFRACR